MAFPLLPLLTAAIPSVINGVSQLFTNSSNRNFYNDSQEKANAFAVAQQERANEYNSIPNQVSQMLQAGLNPNLIGGTDFLGSSPVPNQAVAPPQSVAPQMPVDSISQASLSRSQSKSLDAQTLTENLMRNGKVRLQDDTIINLWVNRDLMKSQINLNGKEASRLTAVVEQIQSSVEQINESTRGERLRNDVYSKTGYQSALASMESILQNTATSAEQARTYKAQARQYLAAAGLLHSQAYGQDIQNRLDNETFDSQKSLREYQATNQRLTNNAIIQKTPYEVSLLRYTADGQKVHVNILRNQDRILSIDAHLAEENKSWLSVQQKADAVNGVLQDISLYNSSVNPVNQAFDRGTKVIDAITP